MQASGSLMGELHKQAKWYYSYDLYTDNERGLQVQDNVIPFDQFQEWVKPVRSGPQKLRKLPHLLIHGNRWEDKEFMSSTEEGKNFVRSLIEAVQQNMKDGHCFPKFNKSNIVFTMTGEVRFKNIAVVPKNGPAKTVTYHSVRDLVTELYNGKIPPELQHLLNLLGNHGSEEHKEKEVLYALHPSIALSLEASWIFLKLYEVLKFRVSEAQREMIYLKLPYLSEWRQIAGTNDVLHDTLTHHSGSYPKLAPQAPEHKRKIHEADVLGLHQKWDSTSASAPNNCHSGTT